MVATKRKCKLCEKMKTKFDYNKQNKYQIRMKDYTREDLGFWLGVSLGLVVGLSLIIIRLGFT